MKTFVLNVFCVFILDFFNVCFKRICFLVKKYRYFFKSSLKRIRILVSKLVHLDLRLSVACSLLRGAEQ